MKKLTKDGKVAVLYSPDFGAGWYSWHAIEELLSQSSAGKSCLLQHGFAVAVYDLLEKRMDEYHGCIG